MSLLNEMLAMQYLVTNTRWCNWDTEAVYGNRCPGAEQVGVKELRAFMYKLKQDCSYLHLLQYIHTTYDVSKHNMFTIQPATIYNH